jgi:hypothetical protein
MTPLPPLPEPLTLADLQRSTPAALDWLWHGYLAPGNVTLLTSQWKTGKTTLVSVLLHHMKSGGHVADLAIAAGTALVLSEESPALWLERSRNFDYGTHVHWFCRPFRTKPTAAQWHQLMDHILAIHSRRRVSLFVLDPLASFLPGRDENNAGPMMEFLAPLQHLTTAGLAVLLLHHPRKQSSQPGNTPRGSGALTGFADILIEMHHPISPAANDRRRHLLAWSRHPQTPPALVIELTADGTNYTNLGSPTDTESAALETTLHDILTTAADKLTRDDILAFWPTPPRPSAVTVWRWLDRSVAAGRLRRSGTGHKTDPFRYWLPETEEAWKQDPLYRLKMQDEEVMRQVMGDLASGRRFS